jgi:hypothetical protein
MGCSGPGCDAGQGYCAPDFTHEPGCGCAGNQGCSFEQDPLLGRFAPLFCDLSRRCAACEWKLDASAIYLHRAAPSNVTLLTDPIGGTTLLNASDMDFPYRVGPRIDFVVTDCAGLGLELNYFSVDGWSVTRDFDNSLASLNVDSIISGYPIANAHVVVESMLHSSEINLRQRLFGQLDFLTGFRWVDMFDRYQASGTSFITGSPIGEKIETRNHLFAWQVGLDGRLFSNDGPFQLGAYVKAGGALNNATSSVQLLDTSTDPNLSLGTLSASDVQCHVAFVGEAGLTGYVKIDKHVACSFGYEVMYVNNVAQPVDQIAQTNLLGGATLINVGNGVFYHGGNLGIELSW